MERTGTKDLEKCFIALLPEEKRAGHTELVIPPRAAGKTEIAIEAKGLTRRFGAFTAVDHVTPVDRARRDLRLPGLQRLRQVDDHEDADRACCRPPRAPPRCSATRSRPAAWRCGSNLGYMTQAFSLYGELTVRENLVLDARLYHMPPDKTKARIDELVKRFGLGPHIDALAEALPMGLRQRLSLAVAVLHEPSS